MAIGQTHTHSSSSSSTGMYSIPTTGGYQCVYCGVYAYGQHHCTKWPTKWPTTAPNTTPITITPAPSIPSPEEVVELETKKRIADALERIADELEKQNKRNPKKARRL